MSAAYGCRVIRLINVAAIPKKSNQLIPPPPLRLEAAGTVVTGLLPLVTILRPGVLSVVVGTSSFSAVS